MQVVRSVIWRRLGALALTSNVTDCRRVAETERSKISILPVADPRWTRWTPLLLGLSDSLIVQHVWRFKYKFEAF